VDWKAEREDTFADANSVYHGFLLTP